MLDFISTLYIKESKPLNMTFLQRLPPAVGLEMKLIGRANYVEFNNSVDYYCKKRGLHWTPSYHHRVHFIYLGFGLLALGGGLPTGKTPICRPSVDGTDPELLAFNLPSILALIT